MEIIEMDILEKQSLNMDIQQTEELNLNMEEGSGTNNYNALSNKPSLNGVLLIGNQTSKDVKVQDEMDEITIQDIDEIMYGGD